MLIINGENAKILETYFKISKKQFTMAYAGNLSICFQLHNQKGYLQFFIDTPKNDDLNYYVNKSYKCIPELDENNINDLEIYDTNNLYCLGDFDKEMTVSFGNIEDDKINISILINEEYISIYFDDKVNLKNKTFTK